MPDTPSAESVQPSYTELLAYAPGKEVVVTKNISPETAEILAKAKEKASQQNGKESLQMLRANTESRFTPLDALALQEKFGGGKAKMDQEGKNVEIKNGDAKPEEQALFESAQEQIQALSGCLEYISIINEAKTSGKNVDGIFEERTRQGYLKDKDYKTLREKTLNYIIAKNPNVFNEAFIDKDGNQIPLNEKHDFVEGALAKDPIFRNSLAESLKKAAVEADNLPKVEVGEEVATLNEEKKVLDLRKDALTVQINSLLKEIDLNPDDEDIKNILGNISNNASFITAERLKTKAFDKLIGNKNENKQVPLSHFFNQYEEAVKKMAEKEQTKNSIALASPTQQGSGRRLQNQAPDSSIFDQYVRDTGNAQKTVDTLREDWIDKYPKEYETYKKIMSFLAEENDEGRKIGEIGIRLNELSGTYEKLNKNKNELDQLNTSVGQKERSTRTTRLRKESEIIDLLDGAVGNAVADALEARYDAVHGAKSEAVKKEKEKKMTEEEKKITRAMESNWVSYDRKKHKKSSDRGQIQNDMRVLSYMGEDGLKRMLLRELGWKTKVGDDEVDIDKKNVFDLDLSTALTEEQRKQLDELYSKHNTKYREKLMADFFISQSLKDKITDRLPFTDKMGLKKHEWQLLEKNFGGALEKGMNESQGFKNYLSQLEASGIKPDFKMKWLLYMLFGLVGATALSGFAAAGGIGAAAVGVKEAGAGAFNIGAALGKGVGALS